METNIQTLISKITAHFEFKSIYLNEFITFNDKPINIVISTKDDVNYMIFVFVDFSELKAICSHIQIEIFTRLKIIMNEENNSVLSKLNKTVDKNSTLIISTIVPNDIATKDLNKLVSSIEEESYYYKKQVLTYKKSDKTFINELLADELGPVTACEKVISSIDNYDLFTLGLGDNIFKFSAMLYEKLPFLTVKINKVDRLVLQDMIKGEFTSEQLDNIKVYGELTTEKAINQWVETIGVENDKTR